jgi:hypothetical protein
MINREEGSISPIFYLQLLRAQRSQKREKTLFAAPLGSAHVRAVSKMLLKSTGVNFISILHAVFACIDPKSIKRYRQLD